MLITVLNYNCLYFIITRTTNKKMTKFLLQIFKQCKVQAISYMPYLTLWDKISQNSAYLKADSQKNFQISQNF